MHPTIPWILLAAVLGLGGMTSASAQSVQRQVDEKGRVSYSDATQERRPVTGQRPADAPPAGQQGQPQYGAGAVVDYTGRYSSQPSGGFKTSGSRTRPTGYPDKTIDQRVNEHNQRMAESKAREQAARDANEQRERDRQLREARARVENDKRKLRELQYENDRR